jgi:hypothetical protein
MMQMSLRFGFLTLMRINCVHVSGRAVRGEDLRAGIAGLNPAGGMDVCLMLVLCVVRYSLCEGLIPRPEESYRLWCVIVCDLETSIMRRPWLALGCCARKK